MIIHWMRIDAMPDSALEMSRRLAGILGLAVPQYAFRADTVRHLTGLGLAATALATSGRVDRSTRFLREPGGKPYFQTGTGRFEFNISHSGEYVVCLTDSHPVGVDIEQIRTMHQDVTDSFFTDAERRFLAELPDAERNEGFFTLWTMKESYLKALGEGLLGELSGTEMIESNGTLRHWLNGWHIEVITDFEGYRLAFCGKSAEKGCDLVSIIPAEIKTAVLLVAEAMPGDGD